MNCFPYPGNKARHADWILDHMADHECYVELFGGAAGVLFNKPRSKIEVYNDLNGDIPHFFRVLRDRGDELQEWLRNVPYSREVHEEWIEEYANGARAEDDIERAGRFFTLRYTSFGAEIATKSGFKSGCGTRDLARDYLSKTESLTKFRDRLRGVEIESQPALQILDRHDSPETVFYADPPYIGSERRYAGEKFNHKKLAEKAAEIEGKILISYDSLPPFYGEPFESVSKDSNFNCDNSGGTKDATEYLIMNYDPDQTPMFRESNQSGLEAFE